MVIFLIVYDHESIELKIILTFNLVVKSIFFNKIPTIHYVSGFSLKIVMIKIRKSIHVSRAVV